MGYSNSIDSLEFVLSQEICAMWYSNSIDSLELVLLQEICEELKHLLLQFHLYFILYAFKGIYDDKSIVRVSLLLLEQVVVYHDLEYMLDGEVVCRLEFHYCAFLGFRVNHYEVNKSQYVLVVDFLLIYNDLGFKGLCENI